MLNKYQQTLYDNLINLVENPAFYYQDFQLDDNVYRIFNYRLASYSDFCLPGALECRGIMFLVSGMEEDATPLALVSHPMEKFFNKDENPMATGLDLSKIEEIELKADGSLISTFWHWEDNSFGTLRLKSKGSIFSDQAIDALNWLSETPNWEFFSELRELTLQGYTINMEWTAPTNRIVVGYERPNLVVLNIRDNRNGQYVHYDDIVGTQKYPEIVRRWTQRLCVDDPVKFVEQIPEMKGIEGYVVRLESGQRLKIKTKWYLAQHRAKDMVDSDRRLYEAVLAESTDDLRTLFHDNPQVISRIEKMERVVDDIYNNLIDSVERFYSENKHLDRKEYAILGQQQLDRRVFGIAMSLYTGKSVDYKEFMIKRWKDFEHEITEKMGEYNETT